MYNIETLGKLSKLNRRTIRYYVQRELLSPPIGSGRGSYYTDEHLSLLKQIKRWSNQGMPISQMKAILNGNVQESEPNSSSKAAYRTEKSIYQRVKLGHGLELHTKTGELSNQEITDIVKAITKIIAKEK